MNNKIIINFSEYKNIIYIIIIFILTEILIFCCLSWTLHFSSISPSIALFVKYQAYIPFKCIYPYDNDYLGLALLNTILLVSASGFLSWGEKFCSTKKFSITFLFFFLTLTCLSSFLFLLAQISEFSRLPYSILEGIHSSCFIGIVGLHMCHVTLGLIALLITTLLLIIHKY